MRILLAQNSRYYPSHGGGDKSNRLLIEALAARGHTCVAVARTSGFSPSDEKRLLDDLAARGVSPSSTEGGIVRFTHAGVDIRTVANQPGFRSYFSKTLEDFRPEAILASTDDPAQLLLEAAIRFDSARVIYLARATLALPFGPDCAFPSASKTEWLSRADAVVGVSQYVADYIERWSGIHAAHVPISLLEKGSYEPVGRFDNEFVTMGNPCAVKGISIFLALAARMPEVRFAAVPMWGTNDRDHQDLEAHPNITLLPPVDEIAALFARTRVLLVPSLWAEARSRIVIEAMLHGVPVIASKVGGIPEAKLGVDYLLSVRPIEKYHERVDEQMVPVAEVPQQDIGPWEQALRRLLTDREHYEQLAQDSRRAALAYAGQVSVEPFERLLEETLRKPAAHRAAAQPPRTSADPLNSLSPEKRRLLAHRLRAQNSGDWFSNVASSSAARMRLFCFPYAGGGAGVYATWAAHLPDGVAVCSARLPGRETRLREPAFDNIHGLVDALAAAIAPYLDKPFAFFGHSMGAMIAFELARALRKRGLPLPAWLFVSAARAPQMRRGHVLPPPITDGELLEELRQLEGIPLEVAGNQELIDLTLPALRADTALYRNYVYTEEPALTCPIRAFGGLNDSRITRAHLEAWAEQTTNSFAVEMFPGGHFYLREGQSDLLRALAPALAGPAGERNTKP